MAAQARATEEAVVGAVAGSLAAPTSALLGRFDEGGRLRYVGRTRTLHTTLRRALAEGLRAAGARRSWTGPTFTAGWGSRQQLAVYRVVPDAAAEVAVDVARDGGATRCASPGSAPRWRSTTCRGSGRPSE
ncbi:hypothetical protein ACIPSE_43410 [Streptomyces sp. NPDC090106]|uniref:hypothetical protein n=1 Tax=Streptomyces sp. NPDC090106 TaxID=3365946 RepID=UPI0038166E24